MAALDDLQCHFTWITEDELKDHDISKTILSLISEEDYEGAEVMKQPFVAFLWTEGPEADLKKALKIAEEAVLTCQDPRVDEDPCRRRGYELIALSTKAHIQHMLNDETGKEETLLKIGRLTDEDINFGKNKEVDEDDDKASSNDKVTDERKNKIYQACNAGVRAYALNELALNQESLVLFRTAEELDPDCYHWPMGRGVTAGRLQRRLKRVDEDPNFLKTLDQEQEESLIEAVKLSQRKSHLALTRLGDVYYWRGRGHPQDPSTQDKVLLKKAEELFLEAYEINPNSTVLLKRLGKALLEIDREKHESFAEKCLLKAHEIDPLNSMTLHRLGQFYEHATASLRDLQKAEKYYTKAINSGPTRNVAAEVDLGRVRRKQNRSYDGVKHLRDMLKTYTSEEDQIIIKDRLEKLQRNQMTRGFKNLRF